MRYSGTFSQGEVILFILCKIHCFGPGRDPFAGIVLETKAAAVFAPDSVLGAQILTVAEQGAVNAVAAAAFHFFTK